MQGFLTAGKEVGSDRPIINEGNRVESRRLGKRGIKKTPNPFSEGSTSHRVLNGGSGSRRLLPHLIPARPAASKQIASEHATENGALKELALPCTVQPSPLIHNEE